VRPLRVAIVGTGFGVRTQLPAFRLAGGWQVVSLTGRDPARTRSLAETHDVPHALTRFEEALSVGDPDLVCVTTPPVFHREMAKGVLSAGKHCLLDKPMVMTGAEAEDLVAAARVAPGSALVDHELRALPNRQEARRRIHAGDIGQPTVARVTFTSHGRARPGVRWDWWSSASHGGGLLGAIGSHVVDMLRFWLGDVTATRGRLATFARELPDESGRMRPVETDDTCDLWLRMASGALASASMIAVAHVYRGLTWEVHGTAGSLWIEEDGRLFVAERGAGEREDVSLSDALGSEPLLDGTQWARGFVLLARDLAYSIREGVAIPYAATFEDGLATQRVLDAALATAREAMP